MPIRSSSMGGTPKGTTSNRPSLPSVGDTYYNGTLGYLEIYTASGWVPATGANDFNIAVGGLTTSTTLDRPFPSGAYTISSSTADTTYDIYAYNSSNILVGYTKTPSLSVSDSFNKIVILGGTTADLLTFTYKTTFTSIETSSEVLAGPVAISATPTSLPNINDSFTILGKNFASNVEVSFIGNGYSSTVAKSVIRNSATSLTVVRPDNFPVSASPYSIVISNPGVTNPTGSNSHILSNSVTAGTNPSWVTPSALPEIGKNIAYSKTIIASDSENSTISYSLISGAFPTGISLNSETGVISGTYSGVDFINSSIVIRATDQGGNYIDRTFILRSNDPTWVTGNTISYDLNSALSSVFLQATTSDPSDTITYSIVSGTLPTGISLNTSTGALTGTPTTSQASVTFRATDSVGNYTNKTILFNANPTWVTTSLPQGTSNTAYTATLQATDDTSIQSYSIFSGSLPTGLTLNSSTGAITGTITGSGSSVTFRATDSNGGVSNKTLTIQVAVVETFLSSSTWIAPSGVTSVEALVVAGGGSSASRWSSGQDGGTGGGGGGGLVYNSSVSVTPGSSYVITVGAGGTGGVGDAVKGSNGSNTTAFGMTAIGGGAGGGRNSTAGNSGGCGGGNHFNNTASGGSGSQGYAGGRGTGPCGTGPSFGYVDYGNGGGGGGMGGVGQAGGSSTSNQTTCTDGALGGSGLSYSISGSAIVYSVGGTGGGSGFGGGSWNGIYAAGGYSTQSNAPANKGLGAVGVYGRAGFNSNASQDGYNGGSGVVIVKYIS